MQGVLETMRRPILANKALTASSIAIFILVTGVFISMRFLDSFASRLWLLSEFSAQKPPLAREIFLNYPRQSPKIPKTPQTILLNLNFPVNCSVGNQKSACQATCYPSKLTSQTEDPLQPPSPMCPDYFRWIHNDLWPWRETGITEGMLMRAKWAASFRLTIVNGTAYVEIYRPSYQTRDIFTLWGILQLLRRYPGKVPDLDLMFACGDQPVIKAEWYRQKKVYIPPPLFRYSGDDATLDIVFPDWSFWGWPELNIKPWVGLSKDLKEGNRRMRWEDREAHAYWKGNPYVAATRIDMLKCNVSDKQDWGARIFAQNWFLEERRGFKQSDLASQCTHRFKIYIEGIAWSVSEKYILACDSLTLLVKPHYYDFFTRSLMPLQHYWPIKNDDKCRSIKYAVDWGNNHTEEAKAIGKAASNFIQDQLKMDYVYDYMLHILAEYAKLLNYKPSVPRKAVELCSKLMALPGSGLQKKFMEESLTKSPSGASPCTMPPPFDPGTLHSILQKKESSIKQVETWKNEYWDNQNKQT